MAGLKFQAERAAFGLAADKVLKYMNKTDDRTKALLKLVDLTENFAKDRFQPGSYEAARKMIQDPDNKWVQYLNRLFDEVDPHVLKTTALNLGFDAMLYGTKLMHESREKYQCNIPWLILMDPTSACNLKCTGCWAAEYGHKLNLDFDTICSIVEQGRKMGTYMYIYTGGEPLVRKKDLMRICEKYPDCEFLSFTNGTLIDEEFCQEMLRVKNFVPAISLEGSEEANDGRRGEGVYQKVMHAMELLKAHKLPFGVSTCYTSANVDSVSSEEFFDHIIDCGALFVWFFHYMPTGNDAVVELMPNPQQREKMYHKIREYRSTKAIFGMDFQNDAQYVGGCIAGGRRYLHINANGDVDPCVFIHYSGANIKEVSLLDALRQPLFMAYRDHQPFNCNHLKPCPMLENPELLQQMVHETGAKSTDLQSPETVEHLCGKCHTYAKCWSECADKLWSEHPREAKGYQNYKQK